MQPNKTCYIVYFPIGASGYFIISVISHLLHNTKIFVDLFGSCHGIWNNDYTPVVWCNPSHASYDPDTFNIDNLIIAGHRFGLETDHKLPINENYNKILLIKILVDEIDWPTCIAIGNAKFPPHMGYPRQSFHTHIHTYKKLQNLIDSLVLQEKIETTTVAEWQTTQDIVSYRYLQSILKLKQDYQYGQEKFYKLYNITNIYDINYKYIFNKDNRLYDILEAITDKPITDYVRQQHNLYVKRNKKFIGKFLKYIDFNKRSIKKDYP